MKICIIGCSGHGGSVLASRCKTLEFAGIAPGGPDEDVSILLQAAAQQGIEIPYYADWRAMLASCRPDIAVVDPVFSRHGEIAAAALEMGIHVYLEKPAATTPEQLDALEKAARNSTAKLFGMFTHRYDPWFATAKALVEQGAIGTVRLVDARKSYKLGARPDFFKKRDSYGGTIPWVAIHMLDQILWLTGQKPRTVAALHSSGANNGHGDLETAAQMLLGLTGDVCATVTADYYRPAAALTHGDDRIRLVGTDGVLEVRQDLVWLINAQNDGSQPVPLLAPPPIFDGFLDFLAGGSSTAYTDCDGLAAARLALAARQAADTGALIHFDTEQE